MGEADTTKTRLAFFVAWCALFAMIYHSAARDYSLLLMNSATWILSFFTPLTGAAHAEGYVVVSPSANEAMGFRYGLLYSIGFNVVFAPALVLAIRGTNLTSARRALVAIFVMFLLHLLQVCTIFLTSLIDPARMSTPLAVGGWAVSAVNGLSKFLDTMSYALFPLLAWAIVCSDCLLTTLSKPQSSED